MGYLNPSDYLQTLDVFLAHWQSADATLAPATLVLSGAYDSAALQNDRDTIALRMTEIVHATNVHEGLMTGRDQQRSALRERVLQFRTLVRALMPDTPYAGVLPSTPQLASGAGVWLKSLDETVNLWGEIEAAPPAGIVVPLLVAGGYGLAAFSADAAALRATLTSLQQADIDVSTAIARRDETWSAALARLVQYRLAVAGLFPSGHPLLTSLPRLSAAYRRRERAELVETGP